MDGIDFASKGLSEVVLDSFSGKVSTNPTLSGRAMLHLPKEGSPFLDRWALKALEFPRKVRFKAVSNRNREAIRLFKRNQTLFPLTSSRSSSALQNKSAIAGQSISRSAGQVRPPIYDSEPSLKRADSPAATAAGGGDANGSDARAHAEALAQLAAPFQDRILGFFDDDYGSWLLADDNGRVLGLEEYWSEVVEREGKQTPDEALLQASADDDARLKLGVKRYGGLVMDILIQTAEVLDALHDKHLAIGICTPEAFQVKFKPPADEDAEAKPTVETVSDKAIHEWEPKIEIVDLSAAVGIDGFTLPEASALNNILKDTEKRQAVSRQSLNVPSYGSRDGSITPRSSPSSQPAPLNSPIGPSMTHAPPVAATQGASNGSADISHNSRAGSSSAGSTHSLDINASAAGDGDVFSSHARQGGLSSEYFIKHHLRWIAPEALSETGPSERDARVGDVYSFGVLAYELITRSPVEPVHEEVDLLSDVHRHLNHSIVPAADRIQAKSTPYLLPPRLSEILAYCLNKDPSARYSSMKPLMHDLRTFQSMTSSNGDMSLFTVGEADRAARFVLPPGLIAREKQLGSLEAAFLATINPKATAMASNGRSTAASATSMAAAVRDQPGLLETIHGPLPSKGGLGVVTVWGASGSGKSELMKTWAKGLRALKTRRPPLMGWAKLDQHMKKPLNGFVQLFTSLLDQLFSDPCEDVAEWRTKIMTALGTQAPVFLNLIGPEWRDVLLVDRPPFNDEAMEMDWEHFLDSTRFWLKRVLQTFATADRPLVVFLDDIQWLCDELPFWQQLLAPSTTRLEHVFIVAGYRTEGGTSSGEDDVAPTTDQILCPSVMIYVPKLNRPAISRYLQECFHWGETDPKQAYLSNFLASQTSGSPLFLASLICQLVRDGIISFDWSAMRWTFSIDDLPRHTAGIDKFLESVLRSFDSSTQELLMILACLRSSGTKLSYLARLTQMSDTDARAALFPASNAGVVWVSDDTVRFRHDKQRTASAALIPKTRKANIHHHIAQWMLEAGLAEENIFDTVDCFVVARSLGYAIKDERVLAQLALKAAARANRAAAFRQSLEYLRFADELADLTTECSLPFAQSWAEVCAIERLPDLGIEKIETMISIVDGTSSQPRREMLFIELRTLLVRLYINCGRLTEGVAIAFDTIDSVGYTEALRVKLSEESLPRTVEAVMAVTREADRSWFESLEEENMAVLVCKLMSYAGPAIFVSREDHGQSYFNLAVALCARLRSQPLNKRADYTAYLFGVWAITAIATLPIRQACVELAQQLNVRGFFENATSICCVAQLHEWKDLHLLREEFARSYESSVASGNWDAGTYVLGLAFVTMLFSTESMLDHESQLVDWYTIVEQLPPHSQVFVKAPLQACENLADMTRPFERLRSLDGRLIDQPRDLAVVQTLPMYSLEFGLLQMFLKVVFLAPRSEIDSVLCQGNAIYHPFSGTILFPLWVFVSAWYLLTEGTDEDQDEASRKILELQKFATTTDFKMMLLMLKTARSIRKLDQEPYRWTACLVAVEEALDVLLQEGFSFLRGLLSFKWARVLVKLKGEDSPLVAGYAVTAHRSFAKAKTLALVRFVKNYLPGTGKDTSMPLVSLPSETLSAYFPAPIEEPPIPPLVKRHDSGSTETTSEPPSTTMFNEEALAKVDHLDSLTFIRASLVLAQSGNQISVELMRILLQFSRASYGALALSSSGSGGSGSASLNLRASGTYENLVSHDVPLSSATDLCPTSTILHVFRTNKPVLTVAGLDRRPDAFFKGWLPRSLIVLPLVLQGQCRGVVLLLSKSFSATPPAAASIEMIQSLASFAVVAIESTENRSELERQVASRTEALQSALQSTTTFLSHMSHELRTPLHSVLGLLSVLEDSANLTPSERESLTTIRNSGEDLQTVISNVLDISKIQAGGIVAESIPLDLRNLIEISLESVAATAVQKGIEVVYTVGVAEDIPCGLLGDSFRVKQILLNLLSNACKFCPKHEKAVVQVHSSAEAVGDKLRITISVKDTGPGIEASKMDRLFKTFSQVDSTTTRQHGGSGLGLAISKSLANLLGGDAWATSTLGEGATFSFSFIAEKDVHSVPPVRPAHAVPKSAFIIFRNCAMRQVLEKHLVAYRVFPCRTAPTYAEAMRKSNPEALVNSSYDFVFVDATLITDYDLRDIKQMQPKAKIILLTTSLDRSSVIKKFTIDSANVLVRPIRTHSLYDMIRPVSSTTPAVATNVARLAKVGKQFDNTLGETSPLKILLVDDNRVNTVVGRKMLERFGYRDVDCCFDGEQAVNAAEGTRYDVIFMDLSMPVCDGYEANKRISCSPLVGSPPPLVVALTANTDKGTRDLVIDEGFFAFLSKPLNVTALGTVLAQSYTTTQEAGHRRRSSSTSVTGPSPSLNRKAPMPTSKTASPPSMVYLDIFVMGC